MKFGFKNIGPITEAELELGDLTIIAGRNNTGKTYLVYTLYGFLKEWVAWPDFERYFAGNGKNPEATGIDIEQASRKLMEEGRYKRKVSRARLSKERQALIAKLSSQFSDREIANVFSSPADDFADAKISVHFDRDFPEGPYEDEERYLNEMSIFIQYKEEVLTFSIKGPGNFRKSTVAFFLAHSYMRFLLAELPSPFILSAERFGISLFYKELDFTKNRLVEMLQKIGDEKDSDPLSPFVLIDKTASRYALPIKDNIDYTRDIPNIVKRKSGLENSKLHDGIKNLMGGYYKSSANDIRFVSKARKKNPFDIPLHIASSSARGLSDLYFYLRHVARPDELLIIDEPESHLDTRNQIMMARMLAHIVRNGVKVLVTTHSDYILKEINNLIMLNSAFKEKEKVVKRLGYGKDDCLSPESLRCYVAENGGLTPCDIDKFGVDIPVFDKTIDAINKASNELTYRLQDTSEEAGEE